MPVLMVPVIRHAETLDLWTCAAEVLRLASLAPNRPGIYSCASGGSCRHWGLNE